jgi:DNA repair exonuclease SbcCD ATPase subunit
VSQEILLAIISSIGGAITALVGAYVILRRLGVDLRKSRAEAAKIEAETTALKQKLEDEQDVLLASVVEKVIESARSSLILSEKACQDRIEALESRYRKLEELYNKLLGEHEAMKESYEKQTRDLFDRIGLLLVENDTLKGRVASIARDVNTITGGDLLTKAQGKP